jgi:MYXO-CTERM domain-containing protein
MLQGGCTANCNAMGGTLSCNGQFVSVNQSQLNACEMQIAQLLPTVTVTGEASGSCSDDGGTDECMVQAKGSVSCAVASPGIAATSAPLAGLGLGLLGLVLVRRRRAAAR